MTKRLRSGTAEANGVSLYYEIRGSGPSLLFISGAEGDAEEYLRVVELLEDEFTTVCYDRRGFSRSPAPAYYDIAAVGDQADDAAALLRALDMAPALVYGNSSGAIISLALVLRQPEVVTGAMLHEPPLFAGVKDVGLVREGLREVVAEGKVAFLKRVESEEVYNSLSEGYRKRLAADTTWKDLEFDVFEYYRPEDEAIERVRRPVAVMHGLESPPFFGESATWLAARLGVDVTAMPGGHGLHYESPEEVARFIRSFAGAAV
jgi:pimeloyl-ACP methyl ester carboxylesterase